MTKEFPQVLVDAGSILHQFIIDTTPPPPDVNERHVESTTPRKNLAIAMNIMVLQLCDRFSEGKLPADLVGDPDFPRWEMFDWNYTDSDKAIIRNAGLTLATALYEEFKSLGLVHQGRIPYITNRIEARSLIVLDHMPY